MPPNEVWTVGRLLQWTTDYLKRHDAESPRLDAEVLLADSLQCRRIELYTAFDQVPAAEKLAAFRDLVRRRAEGTPVAYLVGRREFYSLSFAVSPAVLIPRPETEFVVIAVLDLAKQNPRDRVIDICDVGTGSGAIAVSLAKHLPACRVLALDVSVEALQVAAGNVASHSVSERVELLQSDLLAAVPADRQFDFIVSNPPYVSESEAENLPATVRDYEPRQALVAGPMGTEIIRHLIPVAAGRLRVGGHLLMEVSPMIHDAVIEMIAADERLEPASTIKDLSGLPRVVHAVRKV
ncbi:MAG: peptide chain release factor N(5)-glutamine methyltransferase [Rhodopirellula sp.]|nr:peptide chain release factor N(5)-glutamine methyltransferase [Rhodopirellula sp.]